MGVIVFPGWVTYHLPHSTPTVCSYFVYPEKYLFLRDGRYWRLLDGGRYQFSWLIEKGKGKGRGDDDDEVLLGPGLGEIGICDYYHL